MPVSGINLTLSTVNLMPSLSVKVFSICFQAFVLWLYERNYINVTKNLYNIEI